MANTDTDWKSKLAKAQEIAEKAVAELKVANEKFSVDMAEAKKWADAAIECGGEDAKKQWNAFKDNLMKGLKGLIADIDKAIHDFSEKINWVKYRYYIIGAVALVLVILGCVFGGVF